MKNKLSLFLLIGLFSGNIFADELTDFNKIKSAVLKGKSIHIVTDFAKCDSTLKEAKPLTIKGVFTPTTLMVNDDKILSSLTHFTLNNPHFPGKAVYEFVAYQISKENTVNITSQIVDATSYKPLRDKSSFVCKITEGTKIYH